ncbi:Ras- protein Rab-14 [Entomophthora muscae]|uniref:Ras- protein Rab-14 n=2 Tax=Entomophthora muscae TaxID=34485 RepID=A0ACC2T744_9FUNG|nr:Ras- protein Rab-14 [Entomophthora muscae]KAJ9070301.1 Ras- protein Rab-14 [Entomophthora muscae]
MSARDSDYSYNYIFKFIIIGERGTGKSCLLRQFIDKKFTDNISQTIGVDFGTRIIAVEDQRIKLQIWDTAGQERFKSITRSYYRGAAGALLVYDISRRSTFTHVSNWLEDLKKSNTPNIFMVLVGNKSDLSDHREVSYEEANRFAQINGMQFIEASAKSGDMVDDCFIEPSKKIYGLVLSGGVDFQAQDSGIQKKASVGASLSVPSSNRNSTWSCC